jgi:hypothetical protein
MATGRQGGSRAPETRHAGPNSVISRVLACSTVGVWYVQALLQLTARGPSKSPSFLLLLVCYLF